MRHRSAAWLTPASGSRTIVINQSAGVHKGSPAHSKIALFRSLFRGREDVYPRRFESLRTGKSGYAPACANEWRPGVCEKPRIKCAICPNRQFLPITDAVIRWHLTGADDAGEPFTMGVHPMLLDETCQLLAVDFDGKTWRDDASAYLATCTRRDVPAALERSRSGNGAHVWLFFDGAVAAGLARRERNGRAVRARHSCFDACKACPRRATDFV